mmetsp:Transcript_34825/g.40732  ORF Transcript_34825/g.40732 Transcript_34825/m.40732 type:complete len:93 (+) Transcript_34825:22-300(+)
MTCRSLASGNQPAGDLKAFFIGLHDGPLVFHAAASSSPTHSGTALRRSMVSKSHHEIAVNTLRDVWKNEGLDVRLIDSLCPFRNSELQTKKT